MTFGALGQFGDGDNTPVLTAALPANAFMQAFWRLSRHWQAQREPRASIDDPLAFFCPPPTIGQLLDVAHYAVQDLLRLSPASLRGFNVHSGLICPTAASFACPCTCTGRRSARPLVGRARARCRSPSAEPGPVSQLFRRACLAFTATVSRPARSSAKI